LTLRLLAAGSARSSRSNGAHEDEEEDIGTSAEPPADRERSNT
jgi:hypothetical protein